MIKFRDYQKEIIDKSLSILLNHRFVYLAMEVRPGKTFTSLGIAQALFLKNVLFITKKKAIGSIEKDYQDLAPKFKLIVINYESLHKVSHETIYDFLIIDEAHTIGAFPKQNKTSKQI